MENDKAQRWGGLFHFKWAAFLVACVAISVLQWWVTHKKERIHVRAEQSGL